MNSCKKNEPIRWLQFILLTNQVTLFHLLLITSQFEASFFDNQLTVVKGNNRYTEGRFFCLLIRPTTFQTLSNL